MLRSAGLLLLLLLIGTAPAYAGKRLALVLANSAYLQVPPLPNARNDGEAVAASLRRVGFEVFEGIDLDMAGSQELLRNFAYALEEAELALFFYAGHGIQVGAENYIVPVDAKLERELDLSFQALPMSQVTGLLEREDRTTILILDACRDNPFVPRISRSLSRSRSVGQGLAEISPGLGTLVILATDPGKVALDGAGDHSPFTSALLRYLETPGLEVRQMMTRVRRDVIAATDGAQRPWDNSSLLSDVYLAPGAAPASESVAAAADGVAAPPTDEQRFWDGVQGITDAIRRKTALEHYLESFPDGRFASLARLQIEDIEGLSKAEPLITAALSSQESQLRVVTTETAEAPAGVSVAPDAGAQAPAVGQRGAGAPSGASPVTSGPAAAEAALGFDRDQRRQVQVQLARLGYGVGTPDGIFGARTRQAIAAYQGQAALPATGYLDRATADRLTEAARAVAVSAPVRERPLTRAARREGRHPAGRGPGPAESEDQPASAELSTALPAEAGPPGTGRRAEPAPGTIVACRGPNDPAWVDYRLIALADCKRIAGRWSMP